MSSDDRPSVKHRLRQACKVLAAAAVVIAGVVIVVQRLFPTQPLLTTALLTIAALAGLGMLLAVAVFIEASLNQFTLNHGGTDVQWLWFPWREKPPGLEQLQDPQRDKDKAS
jgi:hypothetical protein